MGLFTEEHLPTKPCVFRPELERTLPHINRDQFLQRGTISLSEMPRSESKHSMAVHEILRRSKTNIPAPCSINGQSPSVRCFSCPQGHPAAPPSRACGGAACQASSHAEGNKEKRKSVSYRIFGNTERMKPLGKTTNDTAEARLWRVPFAYIVGGLVARHFFHHEVKEIFLLAPVIWQDATVLTVSGPP